MSTHASRRSLFDAIFRDEKGDIVIWQMPNAPLIAWTTLRVLLFFLSDNDLSRQLTLLSDAILFTWAYLEITDGASYFRRALGVLVMALTVYGMFKIQL